VYVFCGRTRRSRFWTCLYLTLRPSIFVFFLQTITQITCKPVAGWIHKLLSYWWSAVPATLVDMLPYRTRSDMEAETAHQPLSTQPFHLPPSPYEIPNSKSPAQNFLSHPFRAPPSPYDISNLGPLVQNILPHPDQAKALQSTSRYSTQLNRPGEQAGTNEEWQPFQVLSQSPARERQVFCDRPRAVLDEVNITLWYTYLSTSSNALRCTCYGSFN
jgi:hypothetical protein